MSPNSFRFQILVSVCLAFIFVLPVAAREPDRVIDVWNDVAPGETTRSVGETLPKRDNENPPATRITRITRPQMSVFEPDAEKKTGVAVVIFPGGAFNYVVADKEGSEAADWLNQHGVTAFVLHYRTKDDSGKPLWQRPMQDGQRAISLIRTHADEWKIDPNRIGVLGFSAGGQAAALVATRFDERSYESSDTADKASCRPDFAMLVYPWQLVDEKTHVLMDEIQITAKTPPAFLVHAHDDHASSLSSLFFYAALKKNGVPAELHIYQNGGHGYGLRPVAGSAVHTWPERAADWMRHCDLLNKAEE